MLIITLKGVCIVNRRKRTVSTDLNVRGTYIMDTLNEYLEDVFWVNRKYQRKLVWTLDEKQHFINTILLNYPVPIFLVAKYKLNGEDFYRKDIIDGLQRLNAIFSFIRNEFPSKWKDGNYYYFNVSAIAGFQDLVEKINLIQKEPKLDYAASRDFLNYQLPITTTEVSDTEIEDIFVRINATGRKLSKQDLRQAGAVDSFSDLVRKTACYIRGDITDGDLVRLSEMPSISLGSSRLEYEINVNDTFWLKQGILTDTNIRISRDEELIARLYSYMILGDSVSPSRESLDNMYDSNSSNNGKLNAYIEDYGLIDLMDDFSKVYADFVKIFEAVHSQFSLWLFKDRNVKGKSKVFQAVFLALFDLKKNGYRIENYKEVAFGLKKIGDIEFKEITNEREWNRKIRNNVIRRVTSILEKFMVRHVSPSVSEEQKFKFEQLLILASGAEAQMYDFKLGITTLKDGKPNSAVVSKIVKTLTAMVNTNPKEEAVILIGIADDRESAGQFRKHYKTNWLDVAGCFVTGINAEVKRYWKDLAEYLDYLKICIEKEPIDSGISSQILRNLQHFVYEGRMIIELSLRSDGKPVLYDQKFFERNGSHNKEIAVGSDEFYALMERTMKLK